MLIASMPTHAGEPLFCKKFNNNFNQENNNCSISGNNNQLSKSFTTMSNNFINEENNNNNAKTNEFDSENVDARSRFSHTKALFEQLERCNGDNIPSFYSPRLQRSSNKLSNAFSASMPPKTNIVAPMVPLKSITTNHIFQQKRNAIDSTRSKENNNINLLQVERNFLQLASDLERITSSTRNSSSIINNSTQSNTSNLLLNTNSFTNSISK